MPFSSLRQKAFRSAGNLLLRDEQLVNLLVVQLLLAVARVDDEGSPVGREPNEVVAQAKQLLDLRMAFEDAEVGVAHRLDRHDRRLGVEALVDPDAADLQTT